MKVRVTSRAAAYEVFPAWLATTVHDPRWGRAQETYGEDPALVSAMGVAATRALAAAAVLAPDVSFLMERPQTARPQTAPGQLPPMPTAVIKLNNTAVLREEAVTRRTRALAQLSAPPSPKAVTPQGRAAAVGRTPPSC